MVDSRHPGLASDVEAWRWLGSLGLPSALVATKIDKLGRAERARAGRELERSFNSPVLPVSAATGEGMDALWKLIATTVSPNPQTAEPAVIELASLKDLSVSELTKVAKELDVPNATGMRKQDLIFQILKARSEKSGLHLLGRACSRRCPTGSGSCARRTTTTCPAPTTSTSRRRRSGSSICTRATPCRARSGRRRTASATSR